MRYKNDCNFFESNYIHPVRIHLPHSSTSMMMTVDHPMLDLILYYHHHRILIQSDNGIVLPVHLLEYVQISLTHQNHNYILVQQFQFLNDVNLIQLGKDNHLLDLNHIDLKILSSSINIMRQKNPRISEWNMQGNHREDGENRERENV